MVTNRLKPYFPEPQIKPTHFERLKASVLMKNTPLEAGIFAVLSPLPMLFLSEFVAFITVFALLYAFGVGSFGPWILLVMTLPLLTSPILGILSIIHGFRKIREKRAWFGVVLGFVCLLENALLFLAFAYLGRF